MRIYAILFLAGVLTILLPCILPLVPLVLGVSLAGQRRVRPLVIVAGMAASFVIFTFVLQVVLARFVAAADLIRIASTYVLLLFGVCFLSTDARVQIAVAALGALFFTSHGWLSVLLAALLGTAAVLLAGRVAARIQQLGSNVQHSASAGLGGESLLTALIVGLTLGMVWVPCAGPALGFALALVRDQPGPRALAALAAYAVGAATPLLLVGYGGQQTLRSARALNRHSGVIKRVAGGLLVLSALALRYDWLTDGQVWLSQHTSFGSLASSLEDKLMGKSLVQPALASGARQPGAQAAPALPSLPRVAPAPEFVGLGPWYNSAPLTLASLRGKVVLVDFWTYSCINCVHTLPYVQAYWTRYQNAPFVLVGIHTPEFVFEKSPQNVAAAIQRHGLSYPIAQDNDYGTWNAYGNRYWPAKYLVDGDGIVRYTHFGEGDYEETDLAIRSLLAELGRRPAHVSGPAIGGGAPVASPARDRSPETYLGVRGWSALANGRDQPDGGVHRYIGPSSLALNRYALVGSWRLLEGERQVLAGAEGEIRYRALAGEVNLVLGLEPGTPARIADVEVDGNACKTITIDRHDLFNLWSGPYGEHDVALRVHGHGVAAYAFTFGQ